MRNRDCARVGHDHSLTANADEKEQIQLHCGWELLLGTLEHEAVHSWIAWLIRRYEFPPLLTQLVELGLDVLQFRSHPAIEEFVIPLLAGCGWAFLLLAWGRGVQTEQEAYGNDGYDQRAEGESHVCLLRVVGATFMFDVGLSQSSRDHTTYCSKGLS